MGTYVVGDIHGCYSAFIELMHVIEKNDKDAKYILVGDIVDRGPQVYAMCQWALDNITDNGKYQMVIGNHEREKIDWLEGNKKWLDYCKKPMNNYNLVTCNGERYNFAANINRELKDDNEACDFVVKFIEWCKKLPYYKDIQVNGKRFIIVHANIPDSIVNFKDNTLSKDLSEQDKEFMVWDRDVCGFRLIDDTILINGHTPTIMEEAIPYYIKNRDELMGRIVHTENRYNIDCGAVYKNYYKDSKLAAIRLDDLKEFYVDP